MAPTPATEIATIPLQAGATIEDAETPAGKIWNATLDTISQQDGYQRCYYGRQVEAPTSLDLFVDWDSYEHHQTFTKSPVYGPFEKNLSAIMDGSVNMRHATLDPHPPSNAVGNTSAPVTELIFAYLDGRDETYEANAKKFGEMLVSKSDACKGVSTGWVREQLAAPHGDTSDKKDVFIILVGWESKEKHMEFRGSKDVQDNIHLIRKGVLDVHHTSFVEK